MAKLALITAATLLLAGCTAELRRPSAECPGQQSVAACFDFLKSGAGPAAPLKANGKCLLEYREEGKIHKESFPLKVWIDPPSGMYLQGDIAFDPRAVVAGSNPEEFWLWIKPGGISSYWWGRWDRTDPTFHIPLNPNLVLEAMGCPIDPSMPAEDWFFSKSSGFDILTLERGGVPAKRLYLNRCDCSVAKIEYFFSNRRIAVVMELDEYRMLPGGKLVPTLVRIISRRPDGTDLVKMILRLSSVEETVFTERQRQRFFSRPEPRGFENVYYLDEYGWAEYE